MGGEHAAAAAAVPARSCRSCRSSCPRSRACSAGRSCSRRVRATSTRCSATCRGGATLRGPVDIYTLPWIIIITGLALASFIYLFVSAGFENINGELLEAAQVVGLLARRRLLPRHPAAAAPGARSTARGVALLLGLGQFTAPLLLGAQPGHQRAHDRHVLRDASRRPPQYGVAAALGSPLLVFGVVVLVPEQDPARRPRRGSSRTAARSFRASARAAPSSEPRRSSSLRRRRHAAADHRPRARRALARSGRASSHPSTVHARRLPPDLPRRRDRHRRSRTASSSRWSPSRSRSRSATSPRSILRRPTRVPDRCGRSLDFVVAMPLSIPAVIFGVGFLLAYTNGPLVLYGTKLGDRARLHHADDPVRDAHAALGHGRARRRVHGGVTRLRSRRARGRT